MKDKIVDTVCSVPFCEIWGWWSERDGLAEERYTVCLTFWIDVYESVIYDVGRPVLYCYRNLHSDNCWFETHPCSEVKW